MNMASAVRRFNLYRSILIAFDVQSLSNVLRANCFVIVDEDDNEILADPQTLS